MRKSIVLLTYLSLMGTSLGAQSDWLGVWRVVRLSRGEVQSIFHLAVRAEAEQLLVRVYDQAAAELAVERLQFDGESGLELQLVESGELQVDLRFEFQSEGRLRGEWAEATGRFGTELKAPLQADRLLTNRNWKSWSGLPDLRDKGLFDLSSLLAEAPLSSFGEFNRFWLQRIESRFYFLLTDWLYGAGNTPKAHRLQMLRTLFETLNNEPTRARLQSYRSLLERVRQSRSAAKAHQASAAILVSLPGVEVQRRLLWIPDDKNPGKLMERAFIFLDPLAFSEGPVGRLISEREALLWNFWEGQEVPLAIGVFRQALMLQMAIENQSAEWEISADTLEAVKAEFRDLILANTHSVAPPTRTRLSPSLSLVVGLGLIRSLRSTRSLEDLLSLSEPSIIEIWQAFLDGS